MKSVGVRTACVRTNPLSESRTTWKTTKGAGIEPYSGPVTYFFRVLLRNRRTGSRPRIPRAFDTCSLRSERSIPREKRFGKALGREFDGPRFDSIVGDRSVRNRDRSFFVRSVGTLRVSKVSKRVPSEVLQRTFPIDLFRRVPDGSLVSSRAYRKASDG